MKNNINLLNYWYRFMRYCVTDNLIIDGEILEASAAQRWFILTRWDSSACEGVGCKCAGALGQTGIP